VTTHAPYLLGLAPLGLMLLWAAVEDWRTRRIRNWLTLSMILSGFIQSFMHGNMIGPWQSAGGFLIGFSLGLVLFVLRAVGGGDVKLLAGVGAWLGALGIFEVFCTQAVIGLVIVLIQASSQGRLRILARNSAALTLNLIHLNVVGLEQAALTGESCRSVDRPLPFAVPVLLAVAVLTLLGLSSHLG